MSYQYFAQVKSFLILWIWYDILNSHGDEIQKRNGEITMDICDNRLCWWTEGCNLLARTDELSSKKQISESELRMPKLAELSEPRNAFLLYEPWILCVWQRDISKSLKRREKLLYSHYSYISRRNRIRYR